MRSHLKRCQCWHIIAETMSSLTEIPMRQRNRGSKSFKIPLHFHDFFKTKAWN